MRVIHSSGFPEHERKNFKQIVYSNVITAINILITAARNMDFQLLPSNKVIYTNNFLERIMIHIL